MMFVACPSSATPARLTPTPSQTGAVIDLWGHLRLYSYHSPSRWILGGNMYQADQVAQGAIEAIINSIKPEHREFTTEMLQLVLDRAYVSGKIDGVDELVRVSKWARLPFHRWEM